MDLQDISLRKATSEDFDFLWNLHVDTMKNYVDQTWGWKDQFQKTSFTKQFDPEPMQIIMVNSANIGELVIGNIGAFVFLKQIEISSAWQRKGIGSLLISDLVSKTHEAGGPVMLQVLRVNPAKALYERLGFRVCGQTRTHYMMINEVHSQTK